MTLNIYEMRMKLKIVEGGERRGGGVLINENQPFSILHFALFTCLYEPVISK